MAYRGNRYSVPPELAAAQVTVTQLGEGVIDIVTVSRITVGRRSRPRPRPLNRWRWPGPRPEDSRKEHIPPTRRPHCGSIAHQRSGRHSPSTTRQSMVVDLAAYERAAHGRNTLA